MRSRFAFLIIQIHHSFLICFLIFSCFTLAFHLLFQNKCFILRQLNRSIDRYNYFIISEITHCPFRRNTTPVNINVGRNIFLCELLSGVLLSGCRKPFYTSIHYVTLSVFCMTPSTDLVVAIVAQVSDVTNDPLVKFEIKHAINTICYASI